MRHNRIYTIIVLAIAAMVVAGCQKPYEKHWGLEVDSTAYHLSYSDGVFPLFVYCSGDWKASFDSDVDWIKIQKGTECGTGNGIVRMLYRYNEVAPRSVNLVITSGQFSKTVAISQDYDTIQLVVE